MKSWYDLNLAILTEKTWLKLQKKKRYWSQCILLVANTESTKRNIALFFRCERAISKDGAIEKTSWLSCFI